MQSKNEFKRLVLIRYTFMKHYCEKYIWLLRLSENNMIQKRSEAVVCVTS